MREFHFWFMTNVLQLTIVAASLDEAWSKLQQTIKCQATQSAIVNGCRLDIANIDDEDRWELDSEDDAREGVMRLETE